MNYVQRVIIWNAVDSGLNNMGSHLRFVFNSFQKFSIKSKGRYYLRQGIETKQYFMLNKKMRSMQWQRWWVSRTTRLLWRLRVCKVKTSQSDWRFFHTRDIPGLLSNLLAPIGKISAFEILLKNTNLNWWVNYNKSVHLWARYSTSSGAPTVHWHLWTHKRHLCPFLIFKIRVVSYRISQ